MRILQVIPFFSPQMGGSAEVAYQISKHLALRNHAVVVATTDYARQAVGYAAAGVQVVAIPNWVAGWGFYLNPGLIAWAKQNLGSFDLVHLHTLRTFQNAVAAHFAARYAKPYLISTHGTLPVIIERKLPKHIFDLLVGRRILDRAAGFHAVSEAEVAQFLAHRLPEHKIHMIYNGLDLRAFENLPEPGSFRLKLSIPVKTKIILHLGRIHKTKGIDALIRAFAMYVMQHTSAVLVVAGPDDGEQAVLENLVKSLHLDHQVIFTGALYGMEKLALLQDANLVVSTGVYEIFGLVPFEAILCGTPVIVSEDCGAGSLVSQSGMGWLVKTGDVPDLAQKLHAALSDPSTGQKMVQCGKAFIRQQLDWMHLTQKLETLYQELIHA